MSDAVASRRAGWRADGPRAASGEAGFTLLEVLAALFIVSMISAAGLAVMNNALNAQDVMNAREVRLRELQVSRALLRDDIAQMTRRVVREQFGEPNPFVFQGGLTDSEAPLLAFTRSGWSNPGGVEPRGPLQHVAYFWRGEDLVRRTRLRADVTPDTPIIEQVVLTGVQELRVTFASNEWDGAPVWLDLWEVTLETQAFTPVPRLIALDFTLQGVGDVRHVFAAPDLPVEGLAETG